MSRACHYKGVLLWELFQDWDVPAGRTGDTYYQGLRQLRGGHNPRSSNFDREATVLCHIRPGAGYADLDKGMALKLLQLQLDDELIGVSGTEGDLSLAQDDTDRADVTAGPYGAGSDVVVSHGAFDSGWAPAVDRYVLVRQPTTGKGWVTKITATGVGTVSLQTVTETIDNTWDLVYVQAVLPSTIYETTEHGDSASAEREEHWRPEVRYRFRTAAALISSTAHAVPRGNT